MSLEASSTRRTQRRAQILEEARALVVEEGLVSLTFGRLEARLAFTRGVITYHFRNKDDLVHALLDEAIREIDGAAEAHWVEVESLEDRVQAVVRSMVAGFWSHPDAMVVLVNFWSRVGTDPRAAEANAALYRRYRRGAAALVARGQRDGVFREDRIPDSVAVMLVGIVIGICAQAWFEPEAVDVEAAVSVAEAAVRAVLARPEVSQA